MHRTQEARSLKEHLEKTFKERLSSISDYTQTAKIIMDRFTMIGSLDQSDEVELYRAGYESSGRTMKWMNRVKKE
jgi:Ni,Fe-hydrogenase III large subunit